MCDFVWVIEREWQARGSYSTETAAARQLHLEVAKSMWQFIEHGRGRRDRPRRITGTGRIQIAVTRDGGGGNYEGVGGASGAGGCHGVVLV